MPSQLENPANVVTPAPSADSWGDCDDGAYDAALATWSKRLTGLMAILAMSVAGVVMVGWLANIPVLLGVVPGWATMKFNTALGFALAGASLWCWRDRQPSTGKRRLALGLAAVVTVIGAVSAWEHVRDVSLGLDELVVTDPGTDPLVARPGLMSMASALGFLLAGTALLLVDATGRFRRHLSPALGILTLVAGGIGCLTYLLGGNALYEFLLYSSMAVHTALGFVVVGAGILLARPRAGILDALSSPRMGGFVARRLVPVAVLLPVLFAAFRLAGEKAGWYGTEVGVSLMALTSTALFFGAIWFCARSINGLHSELLARHLESARYVALVDSSVDAIIGKTLGGVVTSWNPGAEKMFGYSADMMIGQSIRRLLPPDRGTEEDTILGRIARGERVEPFDTQRIHQDGRSIDVSVASSPIIDQAGRVVGASKVVRDVSERRELIHQLRASLRETSEFKLALDQHAIVATTDPRGKITYVNDQFCTISGYSREEILGQDHRILNSSYHPKDYIADLWATISGGNVWHGEIRNRAKDGRLYWVDTTIVPFLDERGQPRQYMAIRSDITAIKRTQEDLLRSNQDLEQFAYVASHDLQEPLRAVAGCLQILQRRYTAQLDARADELIGHSVDGANRMQTLIEGLLTFSRVGTGGGNFESCEARAAVDGACVNLATVIGESKAEIVCGALPSVRADRIQLTMLFQNLIGNALKFRGDVSPRLEIEAMRRADLWVFTVRDNGIGIAAEHAERIFVIFQRLHTRREYPGTGLGLAICKKIVERHGGQIWLQPEDRRGTTFQFSLPAV